MEQKLITISCGGWNTQLVDGSYNVDLMNINMHFAYENVNNNLWSLGVSWCVRKLVFYHIIYIIYVPVEESIAVKSVFVERASSMIVQNYGHCAGPDYAK